MRTSERTPEFPLPPPPIPHEDRHVPAQPISLCLPLCCVLLINQAGTLGSACSFRLGPIP